jgi:hypothetical protein|tara:strand:- start:131 stop:346 length:216 start_codon:yes stop_codon:yes gene_type:complete
MHIQLEFDFYVQQQPEQLILHLDSFAEFDFRSYDPAMTFGAVNSFSDATRSLNSDNLRVSVSQMPAGMPLD